MGKNNQKNGETACFSRLNRKISKESGFISSKIEEDYDIKQRISLFSFKLCGDIVYPPATTNNARQCILVFFKIFLKIFRKNILPILYLTRIYIFKWK